MSADIDTICGVLEDTLKVVDGLPSELEFGIPDTGMDGLSFQGYYELSEESYEYIAQWPVYPTQGELYITMLYVFNFSDAPQRMSHRKYMTSRSALIRNAIMAANNSPNGAFIATAKCKMELRHIRYSHKGGDNRFGLLCTLVAGEYELS